MSDLTKTARGRAEAAFQATQTEAREREKVRAETAAVIDAVEDKTARLKAQRLEREAEAKDPVASTEMDAHRASEMKAQAARDTQLRNAQVRKGAP